MREIKVPKGIILKLDDGTARFVPNHAPATQPDPGVLRADYPAFKRAVEAAALATCAGKLFPAYNCLHLRQLSGTLTVFAWDTDGLSIQASLPAVGADGEWLLPKKPVLVAVKPRKATTPLEMRMDSWRARIGGETIQIPADVMPEDYCRDDKNTWLIKREVKMPAEEFAAAINEVLYAAPENDTRYFLNGVLFDFIASGPQAGLHLVATDAHRLVRRKLAVRHQEDGRYILSFSAAAALAKVCAGARGNLCLTVQHDSVYPSHERLVFDLPDKVRLTGKVIDGRFPDYWGVIPSGAENRIELQREAALSVLVKMRNEYKEYASRSGRKKYTASSLRMYFSPSAVTFQVDDSHRPEGSTWTPPRGECPAIVTGVTPEYILINYWYLVEMLRHYPDDDVPFNLFDSDLKMLSISTEKNDVIIMRINM